MVFVIRKIARPGCRFLTFSDSPYAAREKCELGTLAIGKRCQERISATGWGRDGQFAESALDTLCVAAQPGLMVAASASRCCFL